MYIWIRQNQKLCSQTTIKFIYFPTFLSQKKIGLWVITHLASSVSSGIQTKAHRRRLQCSTSMYTALVSNMQTCNCTSVQADQRLFLLPDNETAPWRKGFWIWLTERFFQTGGKMIIQINMFILIKSIHHKAASLVNPMSTLLLTQYKWMFSKSSPGD